MWTIVVGSEVCILAFGNRLFKALGITNRSELRLFAQKSGISVKKLEYYNEEGILPSRTDLPRILNVSGLSELELKLKLGIIDNFILNAIGEHSGEIVKLIEEDINVKSEDYAYKRVFETSLGTLYQGDCLSLMDDMEKESIDLIFADPPFNLNKVYESIMNDKLTKQEYLEWTEKWVLKCIDLLKEGGSIFIWNLPKWNTYIANILNQYLSFRHWIAVDIKYRLPIKNRLYPSHYALLYYTKGDRPNTFNEQRLPLEICRHCGGDIHDYGGYKDKLNPNGINLTDVWYDIPPVRHSKYKTRDSNELSIKLLERVISLASNEGDIVFDPFGGSGTTYIVAEILNRRWIGIEIGPTDTIIDRFNDIGFHRSLIAEIQRNKNKLFTEEMVEIRKQNGHWLPETLPKRKNKQISLELN
ncbi:MAG: site-specific DNA-methyltransferase [Peptococcaceae bacterium]|nr:site-specific DNA-methyltransferase [Peptococcaceae bacterium]